MIYAGTSPYDNGYKDSDYNTTIGYSRYNINKDDNTYVGYMYGTAGASTYAETHANTNNSIIKTLIDTWYQNNLSIYSYAIADAIYCNDRNPVSLPAFGLTGTGVGTEYTAYADASRNWLSHNPSLKCTNANDRFTVNESNGNGALTYPVGLITTDEVSFAGAVGPDIVNNTYIKNSAYYLYNARDYWTMTADAYGPINTSTPEAFVGNVNGGGLNGFNVSDSGGSARPVVSLRSDAISGGSGTMIDPFVVG